PRTATSFLMFSGPGRAYACSQSHTVCLLTPQASASPVCVSNASCLSRLKVFMPAALPLQYVTEVYPFLIQKCKDSTQTRKNILPGAERRTFSGHSVSQTCPSSFVVVK